MKPKIIIYSTPTCPYCHQAKLFLTDQAIEFEDINVAEDKKSAEEMIKKSGQTGVPVIDINGKIIVGFDREAIKAALEL